MMLGAFIVLLIVVLFTAHMMRVSIIEPIPIFVLPWLFSAFLLTLEIVEYERVFVGATFTLVSVSVLAFVCGSLLRRIMNKQKLRLHREIKPHKFPFVLNVFFVVAILLYITSIFIELAKLDTLSNVLGGLDLSESRSLQQDKFHSGRMEYFDVLQAIFRPWAIVFAISLPLIYKEDGKCLFILGLLSWVVLTFESYIFGGRFLFAFVSVGIVFCFLIGPYLKGAPFKAGMLLNRNVFLQSTVLFLSGSLFIYIVFVWFPLYRNPKLMSDIGYHVYNISGGFPSERARLLMDIWGDEIAGPLVFSSSYFTTPIPFLTFYWEKSDFMEWHEAGAYNFPVFEKVLSLVTREPNEWLEIRQRLGKISYGAGYSSNIWATGVRDLIVDFGAFGAPVAIFVYGFLCQSVFELARRNPAFETIVLYVLLCICSLMFAFTSLFYVGSVMNSILLCVGLMIIRPLFMTKNERTVHPV